MGATLHFTGICCQPGAFSVFSLIPRDALRLGHPIPTSKSSDLARAIQLRLWSGRSPRQSVPLPMGTPPRSWGLGAEPGLGHQGHLDPRSRRPVPRPCSEGSDLCGTPAGSPSG